MHALWIFIRYPTVFIRYPTHRSGYLVWYPSRGPITVVSSSNLIFGTRFPHAKSQPPDLLPDMVKEEFLQSPPTAFTVQEVHHTTDLQIIGSVKDQLVLVSHVLLSGLSIMYPHFVRRGPRTSHEQRKNIVCSCSPIGLLALLGMDPMPDRTPRRIALFPATVQKHSHFILRRNGSQQ